MSDRTVAKTNNYWSAIERQDQASILHPFTVLKDFAEGRQRPRILTGGQGVFVRDQDGRELLDGFAGLYCVNIGYGRTEVAEAIARQAHELAYYHAYAGCSTEPLIQLSERLVRMGPGRMSKVFFGLSGSDANETQAKLVWYYNNMLGRTAKKKIIARERGYHGCTVISGSMTGMSFYHEAVDIPLAVIKRTGVPHHYWGARPGESELEFSQRRADELEELILAEGPDTVGAFIGEPVLGTGGLIPPPAGYWAAIQKVLRKYDLLLIVDEVVTGFGRTGRMFGCNTYDIEPDLVTLAKGLTSAYVPMSACLVSERVFDVIKQGSDRFGAFNHGFTYSGHPLAAAAANAALDIVEQEDLAGNAARMGARLQNLFRSAFADHPLVGEVRGVGLMAALEFVARKSTKTRFDSTLKVGARLAAAALDCGLITRAMPHGDILGFSPPLVIRAEEVDALVARTKQAVDRVAQELERSGAWQPEA